MNRAGMLETPDGLLSRTRRPWTQAGALLIGGILKVGRRIASAKAYRWLMEGLRWRISAERRRSGPEFSRTAEHRHTRCVRLLYSKIRWAPVCTSVSPALSYPGWRIELLSGSKARLFSVGLLATTTLQVQKKSGTFYLERPFYRLMSHSVGDATCLSSVSSTFGSRWRGIAIP